jgi:von Willebrand factor type A domain
MRTVIPTTASLILLALAASGCGAGGPGTGVSTTTNSGPGAGGKASVSMSTGGATSSSSAGTLSLAPTPDSLGGSSGGGGLLPDMACATGTASASLAGVNMIVAFDRSGSMRESAVDNGPTRWELTSAALKGFFSSPDAAGLKLALRFFPDDNPAAGCNDKACDAVACSQPLVALGTLSAQPTPVDTQEQALLDATDKSAPGGGMGGGTPTSAALAGALAWANAQHQLTPNENSVVVLVTDGDPHGCDENILNISKLASDAFASDNVRTYVIGLTGSREAAMDSIAMAGGTTKGIFVSDGANTQQDLLDALAAIRGQVLDCDFPLPTPKPGATVDPTRINVNVTATGGGKTTLAQVPDEAACTGTPGWHYDNPTSPTRIVLCKSSCDAVTVDVMASLEVLLGCETITKVPQ